MIFGLRLIGKVGAATMAITSHGALRLGQLAGRLPVTLTTALRRERSVASDNQLLLKAAVDMDELKLNSWAEF